MGDVTPVLDRLDQDRDGALDRLFELLRIASVSTDPAFAPRCLDAAEWLSRDLRSMGFEASVRPTTGHPMVVGHWRGAGNGAPHYLFYGHYDVQPPDPLDLWEYPPFEPRLITHPDGHSEIRARGAQDDKGQLMTFMEACRAWMACGGPPCNLTVFFEGEEECGSPSLPGFLAENAGELRADAALVCDTSMWDRQTPAITTSLRGMVGDEVTVHAANRDLHSGLYGGVARNPIHVLSRILGALHDENGRVTLDGFYDGVPETPGEQRDQWAALGLTPESFLGPVGLSQPMGEPGRSLPEMLWARPTAEVNGITGGYQGEGTKTVLPAQASAKLSFRLVGTQDPLAVREAFRAHVRAMLPPDCTARFTAYGAGAALSLPPDSDPVIRARAALSAEWGCDTVLAGMGGSIPVVGDFRRALGMDCLLIGFGLDDDRIHAPNEKYELSSFQGGARSWARVLAALVG